MFLRKLRTGWRLIKSRKWTTFIKCTRKNIRQLILNSKNGNLFIYRSKIGFEFVCFPSSTPSVHLYINGFPEDIESKIASHWLCEKDFCLDIGANIGYYSVLFANRVMASGKVIAVEAAPQTAEYLSLATKMLSLEQVKLENVCVTNKVGNVEFMVSCNGLHEEQQSLRVKPTEKRFYRRKIVKSTTINELIKKYEIDKGVSLAKIDIEGAEPLALDGATLLFNKDVAPLFIVEVNKRALSRFNFKMNDVLKFFLSDLFEIYISNITWGHPEFGALYNLSDSSIYDFPWHLNIIAIPKVGKYANRKKQIRKYLCNQDRLSNKP